MNKTYTTTQTQDYTKDREKYEAQKIIQDEISRIPSNPISIIRNSKYRESRLAAIIYIAETCIEENINLSRDKHFKYFQEFIHIINNDKDKIVKLYSILYLGSIANGPNDGQNALYNKEITDKLSGIAGINTYYPFEQKEAAIKSFTLIKDFSPVLRTLKSINDKHIKKRNSFSFSTTNEDAKMQMAIIEVIGESARSNNPDALKILEDYAKLETRNFRNDLSDPTWNNSVDPVTKMAATFALADIQTRFDRSNTVCINSLHSIASDNTYPFEIRKNSIDYLESIVGSRQESKKDGSTVTLIGGVDYSFVYYEEKRKQEVKNVMAAMDVILMATMVGDVVLLAKTGAKALMEFAVNPGQSIKVFKNISKIIKEQITKSFGGYKDALRSEYNLVKITEEAKALKTPKKLSPIKIEVNNVAKTDIVPVPKTTNFAAKTTQKALPVTGTNTAVKIENLTYEQSIGSNNIQKLNLRAKVTDVAGNSVEQNIGFIEFKITPENNLYVKMMRVDEKFQGAKLSEEILKEAINRSGGVKGIASELAETNAALFYREYAINNGLVDESYKKSLDILLKDDSWAAQEKWKQLVSNDIKIKSASSSPIIKESSTGPFANNVRDALKKTPAYKSLSKMGYSNIRSIDISNPSSVSFILN